MDKWYYITKISKASDFYGDKLIDMLEYYNKYGLKDITYKEAKDYWIMMTRRNKDG